MALVDHALMGNHDARDGLCKELPRLISMQTFTRVSIHRRLLINAFELTFQFSAAESGYIPGILYMMSKVYRPREFGLRIAFLLCMSSISGIVSGPIAYGTSFLEGQKGLHGWQYLFILEGVPTICLSVISYFYLFDDIHHVPWLTNAQKALHRHYTRSPKEEAAVTIKSFLKSCFDWKTILFSLVFFLNATNVVSYQIFTPTIIDGFGFPVLTSQLLSAPPNVIQTIMIVLGGYLADKYNNKRGILMVTGFFTAAMGFLMLFVLESRWGKSLFIDKAMTEITLIIFAIYSSLWRSIYYILWIRITRYDALMNFA